MKKRILRGFGMAFQLASPIWLTIEKPPNYFNFAISLFDPGPALPRAEMPYSGFTGG